MAGFRKAKAEQAALKMGVYGPPGSGKTFTSLLIAEGLGAISGKRVAYIDTEHGTDFYCKDVPSRAAHPAAFDFDAIYTKSLMEVLAEVRAIDFNTYGVLVLDSVTHLWEAAIAAFSGRQTSAGTIPMHAWGKIKKPYKDLMSFLLSSPLHVIMCGRQGVEYATNEETDELKAVGVKMKAEGETPYEPHILIRMEAIKPKKTNEVAQIVAYAEKDRTGVLAGRSFVNPTFDTLVKPLLPLLGGTQAHIATSDETAAKDAEQMADQDRQRAETSAKLLREFSARIQLANDGAALKAIGKEITAQLKAQMSPADVAQLRETYQVREAEVGKAEAVAK
ncbi:MAG TPA: AAA family ATPase [Burkholderiales bacterium]|nr:AAA family ATPase [Burkholderiales bacterium]